MQKLLTAKEAADIFRLNTFTIYEWARSGRIPAVRVGRAVRFSPAALAALVEGAEVVPPQELPPRVARRSARQRGKNVRP